MSSYQYYEFRALDKALTEQEQSSIKSLSSRAQVTPNSASFTYNYGDFRADPTQLLIDHFDALFYVSTYGSTRLAFRFPKALVDLRAIDQYCDEEQVTLSELGEFVIVDIDLHEEEAYHDWLEGEDWLPSLVRLRDSLLNEDYRVLYLAWLKYNSDCSYYSDRQTKEPELPAGLNELTPALNDFIEIFDINKDLVQSAARMSEKCIPSADVSQEIKKLSREDCEYFLTQVLEGKPHIEQVLRKRLSASLSSHFSKEVKKKSAQQVRTLQELMDAADKIKQEVSQKEAEETEKERIKALKKLAVQKEQVWKHVDQLINLSKAKHYDEAVNLLVQLKELSVYEEKESVFQERLENQVFIPYKRKSSLKQLLIAEFNLEID